MGKYHAQLIDFQLNGLMKAQILLYRVGGLSLAPRDQVHCCNDDEDICLSKILEHDRCPRLSAINDGLNPFSF